MRRGRRGPRPALRPPPGLRGVRTEPGFRPRDLDSPRGPALRSGACRSHAAAPESARREADPVTHYVIVRADLPRGLQAAQIVHAAGESSPGGLPAGTFAVCLAVPDERALVKLADDLRRAGVAFTLVFEPDAPHNGAAMAIGVAPRRKGELRRHLSALPLLR